MEPFSDTLSSHRGTGREQPEMSVLTLLSLPWEIRQEIYRHSVKDLHINIQVFMGSRSLKRSPHHYTAGRWLVADPAKPCARYKMRYDGGEEVEHPAWLQLVCAQLRAEYLPYLGQHATVWGSHVLPDMPGSEFFSPKDAVTENEKLAFASLGAPPALLRNKIRQLCVSYTDAIKMSEQHGIVLPFPSSLFPALRDVIINTWDPEETLEEVNTLPITIEGYVEKYKASRIQKSPRRGLKKRLGRLQQHLSVATNRDRRWTITLRSSAAQFDFLRESTCWSMYALVSPISHNAVRPAITRANLVQDIEMTESKTGDGYDLSACLAKGFLDYLEDMNQGRLTLVTKVLAAFY